MRLIEVPDVPSGALRFFGRAGPPEGRGEILFVGRGLYVVAGEATIVSDAPGKLRELVRVDRPFVATIADNGVVFVAIADGGTTELVRWGTFPEPLSRIDGTYTQIATDAEGSRVALYRDGQLVMCDGARGHVLWTRGAYLARPRSGRFAVEGDAAAFYSERYDPDEPEHYYYATRIAETGEPVTQHARGAQPRWYKWARSRVERRYEHALVVSRDGARVAAPTHAWQVASGADVRVEPVESWYGSSFSRSGGDYEPRAIAYDDQGELWRASAGNGTWYLESCHASSGRTELPSEVTACAIVPGSRRVVMAMPGEVRLDERVMLGGRARALACADDGSAIAVALGASVSLFDGTGTSLRVLAAELTDLAVARGGDAVAGIDAGHLAIARETGIVRGGPARRVPAFSPDGALVAHATPGWGFAIVDTHTLAPRAGYEDLGSPVNAIAWAPDGASLFTLGADGRITQWPRP